MQVRHFQKEATRKNSHLARPDGAWSLLCLLIIAALFAGGCASTESLVSKSGSSLASGDYARACEFWKKVLDRGERLADAHYGLSECLYELGSYRKAYFHINRALHLSSLPPLAWKSHRGDIAFKLATEKVTERSDVIRFLTEAIDDGSSLSERARVRRAEALAAEGHERLRDGHFAEAVVRFDDALEDRPGADEIVRARAEARYGQGRRAANEGDHRKAADYFTEVLEAHPGHASARIERGSSYYQLARHESERGRDEKAREWLRLALEDVPNHREARDALAATALALAEGRRSAGRFDDAIEYYDEALQHRPGDAQARRGQARCLYELWKKSPESKWQALGPKLEASLAALERIPRSSEERRLLHEALAHVARAAGSFEQVREHAEALKSLGDGHALDPEVAAMAARASYERASTIAAQGGESAEAFALLDDALEFDRRLEPEIDLRRAEIHALDLDFDEAARCARRARGGSTQSELRRRATYDVARYLAVMGQVEEALLELEDFYREDAQAFESARDQAQNDEFFYYLHMDRRFRAWLQGKKRAKWRLISADLHDCRDGHGTAGPCDPYVILRKGRFKEYTSRYVEDNPNPRWEERDHHIADFDLGKNYSVELWDKDGFVTGRDDLIGRAKLERPIFLDDDEYRLDLRSEGDLVAHLSFSVEGTDEPLDSHGRFLAPPVAVVAWPAWNCFSELGINALIDVRRLKALIKTILLELNDSLRGEKFSLSKALQKLATVSVQDLTPSGVRIAISTADFIHCLEEYRQQFLPPGKVEDPSK